MVICAVSVQVRQGFVHVWGRSGPGAEAEAAAAMPLLVPELDPDAADARFPDGSPTLDSGKPYTRDLPYGWEYLMEARFSLDEADFRL